MRYVAVVITAWYFCVGSATATIAGAPARPDRAPLVAYHGIDRGYSLVETAEELDDPQQRYSLDAVRRTPLDARFQVNQSADAHYYARWYRFRLDPSFTRARTWVLRVPVTTDVAELYRPFGTGYRVARFGFMTPPAQRSDRNGDSVVTLEPGDAGKTLYVRTVGGESLTGDVALYLETRESETARVAWNDLRLMFFATVFGVLFMAALLFLLLTRQRFFAAYAAYTFALVVNYLLYLPFGWAHLWPWLPTGINWPFAIVTGFVISLLAINTREFLGTARFMPLLDRLLVASAANALVAYVGLEGVSEATDFNPLMVAYLFVTPLAVAALAATAAVVRVRQGFVPARIYLVGFIGLFGGLFVFIARQNGLIVDSPFTASARDLGNLFEALAFLAALAYSVALANREREAAQLARVRDVERYNVAISRFLPREFLDQLGRADVTQLQLGDHVEREMNVVFTDIRKFTNMSESWSPGENFAFINDYLGQVGPLMRSHGGFIDKYVGDAIMALFPGSSQDALDAAIALQSEVRQFNAQRTGQSPIDVGVGLHRGLLMLGTVGETERFDTTVISDAVNIASRVEGLTKTYGAAILASEAVVGPPFASERYRLRPLGEVQVVGSARPLTLFEVCDGDDARILHHKMTTRDQFVAGLQAYRFGHYGEAEELFGRIADAEMHDRPAIFFRERSNARRKAGERSWDGVERFVSK